MPTLTKYTLYTGLDYADHASWVQYGGDYDSLEMATRAITTLTVVGLRVKLKAHYSNGITTFRIIEGGPRQFTPPPIPAPYEPPPDVVPPPPPPPPPAYIPSLDFSKARNSMYKLLF